MLFISWQEHRRTRAIAQAMDVRLLEITTSRTGARRYIVLCMRTASELVRNRPSVLIIQNPSLVLNLWALFLRPFLRFRLVVDAHNEAVEPVVNPQTWIKRASAFALRSANLVIVTNRFLAEKAENNGARTIVLPDRIPIVELSDSSDRTDDAQKIVAVIATGAPDEPIELVIAVASKFPFLEFHITGRKKRLLDRLGEPIPANVRLLGYVPDETYWQLLREACLVVDLSTMPDCLVCGAYESLAVTTPMVLSKNRASTELFGACAILVDNNEQEIELALRRFLDSSETWRKKVAKYRVEYRQVWQEHYTNAMREINVLKA